jgi:hypothetical protein
MALSRHEFANDPAAGRTTGQEGRRDADDATARSWPADDPESVGRMTDVIATHPALWNGDIGEDA